MSDPSKISLVIPAYNEAEIIGQVVMAMLGSARWHEVLVIDDGSSDDTAGAAEAAGARVIRHPYNKGNGAAVKTAIRNARGEFMLIVDGDGQHRPSDARRVVSRLGDYDLIIGARAGSTQATRARRVRATVRGHSSLPRF